MADFDCFSFFIINYFGLSNVDGVEGVLRQINETVSSIPDGSYSLAITSSVLGAFTAALSVLFFNCLYWQHLNKKNYIAHYAKVALEDLCKFEDAALEYWIHDKNKANDKLMRFLEIRIQAYHSTMIHSFNGLTEEIKNEMDKQALKCFVSDVFDDATGTDFESPHKKSNKKITLKISKRCSLIKSVLLKYSHVKQ